jgi:hypothetical protein
MFATKSHLITSEHTRAIYEEVGERLRYLLRADYATLPPTLQDLMDRLSQLECDAPSIAPSIEEMVPGRSPERKLSPIAEPCN